MHKVSYLPGGTLLNISYATEGSSSEDVRGHVETGSPLDHQIAGGRVRAQGGVYPGSSGSQNRVTCRKGRAIFRATF